MTVVCVPVHQPWASMMAHGIKAVKAAAQSTTHRGPTGIYACRNPDGLDELALRDPDVQRGMRLAGIPFDRFSLTGLPAHTAFGAVVGVADLVGCVRTEDAPEAVLEAQYEFGDRGPGKYLWVFANARPLAAPVPARGNVALFKVDIGDA